MPINLGMTGLDIVGEADENDLRSLREVEAFAASDRYVEPTQQTTETFLRMREENTAAVREYRWEKQEELEREDVDRVGQILSQEIFLRGLNRITTARYNTFSRRGRVGLSVLVGSEWKYVCAVQLGYMQEYSVMTFDAHKLPLAESYRGWRTVLLRLITMGFISEQAAHEIFGPPQICDASLRYRRELWRYRNRKVN